TDPCQRLRTKEDVPQGLRATVGLAPVALSVCPRCVEDLCRLHASLFCFLPTRSKEHHSMVVDAVRTYLDAANGLTELSRRDAVAAARALLRSDGRAVGAATAEGEAAPRVGQSIQALAGELIETSQANRTAIADLVREEVGRQL